MAKENQTTKISIGFWGVLVLGLVFLKAAKLTDISWWWIWSPIWIPASLAIIGLIILFIYKIFEK